MAPNAAVCQTGEYNLSSKCNRPLRLEDQAEVRVTAGGRRRPSRGLRSSPPLRGGEWTPQHDERVS